jgi:lipoate-protein ligase A
MKWEILDTGIRSAEENMQIDTDLLRELKEKPRPILHFYEWIGDTATYGYFIDPAKFLNMEGVARRGLKLARRPTGGGIVFHIWDFAFSVLIPEGHPGYSQNTLENYAFVNGAVQKTVKEFLGKEVHLTPTDIGSEAGFCMAKPTKYDVMLEGKKIAGAAQRKQKWGFLHQGTIALMMPPADYLTDVLQEKRVQGAMMTHTFPLTTNLEKARLELRQLLKRYLL